MFKSDGIFSRFMNCLFDILYVGILWIVCSLPVLTAGGIHHSGLLCDGKMCPV